MGGSAGLRIRKPPEPRDVAREFDDSLVVDVVDHGSGKRFSGSSRQLRRAFGGIYRGCWVGARFVWRRPAVPFAEGEFCNIGPCNTGLIEDHPKLGMRRPAGA